jgi:hypothetical protein
VNQSYREHWSLSRELQRRKIIRQWGRRY